jgi:polyisoprenoid-binding protein YceI
MKFFSLFILTAMFITSVVNAQTFFTKAGEISFYSHTPLEEIEAKNEKAVSILNLDEKEIEFSVLIKGFHFKNALMQTHFNENYMDSDVFPKATFKSTSVDLSGFDLQKDGEYPVPVSGILTVKGKDKEINTTAMLKVTRGELEGVTSFVVSPDDFDIEIPSLVKGKIAEEIQVTVKATYQLYEKS